MQRLTICFPNEHLVVTTDFSEYTKAFVQNCTVSNYETETFLVKQDWINQMTHIFLLFRYTKFSRKRNHRGTIFSNIKSNPTLSIESLWPSLLTSSSPPYSQYVFAVWGRAPPPMGLRKGKYIANKTQDAPRSTKDGRVFGRPRV